MIVHQFVPMLEPGAVGAHTLIARDLLRAEGHTSDIYADEVHPASQGQGARPLRDYRRADIIVYQVAIGSVVGDMVLRQREPIIVNYHNFTPLRYLAGWEPVAAHGVAWGHAQLHDLAPRSRLGIADSRFNEADLIEAGFARSTVVPILFDKSALPLPPDGVDSALRSDATTLLFVGRIAPNKAQHDLVKALDAYRRFYDANARLVLVGGGADSPYGLTLRRFVHALDLDGAVTITGSVSPAELAAHYQAADVFVIASDHEGFCVPLLEAMQYELPIVGYAAAAVPETLANAGLLLTVKDPCTLAGAVHRVVTEVPLRAQLRAAGRARLDDFDLARTGPAFLAAVTEGP